MRRLRRSRRSAAHFGLRAIISLGYVPAVKWLAASHFPSCVFSLKPNAGAMLPLRSMRLKKFEVSVHRRTGCALALALLAFDAGTAGAQPPTRFVVVDLQAAMLGTREGKKAVAELEAKVNPRKKDFEQRRLELDQLRKQLQDPALTRERQTELLDEVDRKSRRLERDRQDAQEDLETEEQHLSERFGPKLVAIVNKYASDHHLAVVFDKSNAASPVVYAAATEDITQAIIDAYDQAPPSAAPAETTKESTSTSVGAAKPAARPLAAKKQQ